MRISLSIKNFFIIMFGMLLIIASFWFVNYFLLDRLYLDQKEDTLCKVAEDFRDSYEGDVVEYIDQIQKIENEQGVNIIIADEIGIIQYTTVIQGNPWGKNSSRWKNDFVSIPSTIRPDLENGEVVSFKTTNVTHNTDIMLVYVMLDNNDIMIMEAYLEPIKKSVDFAKMLYYYIAIGAAFVGIITSLVISRRMTKPISKLSLIARRMANLDFSRKYDDVHNDELDELGESINLLSERLDETLNQLSRANNKLLDDIEKEKEIDRKRKEFISNVSHELKTPITLIKGYARGLSDGTATNKSDLKYYYGVIEDEAHKMSIFVDELLELSRMEREGFELAKEPFDLISMVKKIEQRYENVFSDNKIRYILCKKHDAITVKADPLRIEQVLDNLINNAVRFNDDRKGIVIKVLKREKRTIVKVFNTGSSIPKDELSKIWGSFYKVESTKGDEKGGMGLGLYVVKKILDLHDVNYGVRNVKGGVEFWFDIENF